LMTHERIQASLHFNLKSEDALNFLPSDKNFWADDG
jgi:hypothetical protein